MKGIRSHIFFAGGVESGSTNIPEKKKEIIVGKKSPRVEGKEEREKKQEVMDGTKNKLDALKEEIFQMQVSSYAGHLDNETKNITSIDAKQAITMLQHRLHSFKDDGYWKSRETQFAGDPERARNILELHFLNKLTQLIIQISEDKKQEGLLEVCKTVGQEGFNDLKKRVGQGNENLVKSIQVQEGVFCLASGNIARAEKLMGKDEQMTGEVMNRIRKGLSHRLGVLLPADALTTEDVKEFMRMSELEQQSQATANNVLQDGPMGTFKMGRGLTEQATVALSRMYKITEKVDRAWFDAAKGNMEPFKLRDENGNPRGQYMVSPLTGQYFDMSKGGTYDQTKTYNPEAPKQVLMVGTIILVGLIASVATAGVGGVLTGALVAEGATATGFTAFTIGTATLATEAALFTGGMKVIGGAVESGYDKLKYGDKFWDTYWDKHLKENWGNEFVTNMIMFGAFKAGGKIAMQSFERGVAKMATKDIAEAAQGIDKVLKESEKKELKALLDGAKRGEKDPFIKLVQQVSSHPKVLLESSSAQQAMVMNLSAEYLSFISFDTGTLALTEQRIPTMEEIAAIAGKDAEMIVMLKTGGKLAEKLGLKKLSEQTGQRLGEKGRRVMDLRLKKLGEIQKLMGEYFTTGDIRKRDLIESKFEGLKEVPENLSEPMAKGDLRRTDYIIDHIQIGKGEDLFAHGTNAKALEGILITGGQVLPQSVLREKGIDITTGESMGISAFNDKKISTVMVHESNIYDMKKYAKLASSDAAITPSNIEAQIKDPLLNTPSLMEHLNRMLQKFDHMSPEERLRFDQLSNIPIVVIGGNNKRNIILANSQIGGEACLPSLPVQIILVPKENIDLVKKMVKSANLDVPVIPLDMENLKYVCRRFENTRRIYWEQRNKETEIGEQQQERLKNENDVISSSERGSDTHTLHTMDDLIKMAEQKGGIVLFHGGLADNTTMDSIDLNRLGSQQNKKRRTYGGFYLADASSKDWADKYAQERNGNVHGFLIDRSARILEIKDRNIDRLSQEQRDELAQKYDLIKGKDVMGRTQYVILNKNIVTAMALEKVQSKKLENFQSSRLFDTVDTRTQFRVKSVILSEEGMKEINERIPGKKLFFFLDLNHMGPPNKFGLGKQLDTFMESLKQLSREAFGSNPHEVLRLGGDEFGGFVPDTPEGRKAIADFVAKIEAKKKDFLDYESDPAIRTQVEQVERYAAIRTTMRRLRSEYKDTCTTEKPFTLEGFAKWLIDKGAVLPEQYASYSLARKTGLLQRDLAQKGLDPNAKEEVMTVSASVLSVGEHPGPAFISRAKGQADKLIHAAKAAGEKTSLVPQEVTADIQDQEDDRYERQNWLEREQQWGVLHAQLEKTMPQDERDKVNHQLELLKITDAGVEGVIRLDLVKNKIARKVFHILQPTEYTIVGMDINGFGAINNNIGYAKGDHIFRGMVEIARKYFPKAQQIRTDGGKDNICIPGSVSPEVLLQVKSDVDAFLFQNTNNSMVLAEAGEKQALSVLEPKSQTNGDLVSTLELGTIKLDSKKKIIDPEMTIESIFKS